MSKKKIILLFTLIFFLTIFIIANKKTTRLIGINYQVIEYQIPVYLKILDFYTRHYNYKYLVNNINKNIDNEKDLILNITKWIINSISKIHKDVDVIDHHPLTIIERKFGTNDQFSDLLSVLLVYSNIESFYLKNFNNYSHPLTFFKTKDHWSLIDPYYGIFFTNKEHVFASIEDLKNGNWQILSLEFDKINNLNFKPIFGNKFNSYDTVINYYSEIFYYLPSNKEIENTNIFDRGGRAYTQKPFSRIKYIIYKKIKKH